MGCFGSKERPPTDIKKKTEEGKKIYSWDKEKRNVDPADFIISKRTGETIVKAPGSIGGQQFVIEDCTDCKIFLCDYTDSVSIDYCTNCYIFVGPVGGSIFIRNCKDVKAVVACQQFRTRDCVDCDFLLYSMTQPIIETSENMRFGCFQFNYDGLKDQFSKSKLVVWNNQWSNIYDFSPSSNNWTLLPPEQATLESLHFPSLPPFPNTSSDDINASEKSVVVPKTWGTRLKPSDMSMFVMFYGENRESTAYTTLSQLQSNPEFIVLQTKSSILTSSQVDNLFPEKEFTTDGLKDGVIGFEIVGEDCISKFSPFLSTLKDVHFSKNYQDAEREAGTFFGQVSLQME
eukprot:TRINITY_DN520_c0_g1_i1.p1 TRINITY_DN520_c0_g1~~TRINITY_DN520_c0_g1_i1.p1  ORF type:complete len:345 (+),score=71.30 TRINITY_DN520_c0_g1_i1:291-1325(+)